MTDTAATHHAVEPDYGALLEANLQRVFNERDPVRRDAAIADLFVVDPVMYEPDAIVTGRQAISDIAGKLLTNFGPDFAFVPEGRGLGHHGMATLRWRAGVPVNAGRIPGQMGGVKAGQ
jgi:hypothetical protein